MSGGLVRYGWSDRIDEQYRALDIDGANPILGRVGRVDRGECDVFTDAGIVRAASDSQRSQSALAPATGDWAVVVDDPDIGLVIDAILPRTSAIVRRDPSEQVIEQVLVANVDVVAVTHGLDRAVNPARLERFLVLAWDSGAQPIIVLTKTDLCDDVAGSVAAAQVARDVPVIATSAVTGAGLDGLRAHLSGGRTLVLLGPSGVGKSHLVNALIGEDAQAIGEVRASDAKGRHTTTTRDMLLVPGGGIVIDTPGIRAVGLWEADAALDRVFADIAAVAEECRFRDCTHRAEPGCAVGAAIVEGKLESERVERYLRMWEEISSQAADAEDRARREDQGRRRRAPGGRRRNR